jgi:hypothetical protein
MLDVKPPLVQKEILFNFATASGMAHYFIQLIIYRYTGAEGNPF